MQTPCKVTLSRDSMLYNNAVIRSGVTHMPVVAVEWFAFLHNDLLIYLFNISSQWPVVLWYVSIRLGKYRYSSCK
jgi:hypothetical protein